MKQIHIQILIIACSLWSCLAAASGETEAVIDVGEDRLEANQQAQRSVDDLYDQTRTLVEEYQGLLKIVDGLKVYNRILKKQLDNQEEEKLALNASIANAAVIERQILPLLTRVLDGLDDYIKVDLPFLKDERKKRVGDLRNIIVRSELTNAEKTRRIFEALQIENEYGNTIESYKGKLNIADKTFDVDYLRVGRVAFTYRTVGAGSYGYWDTQSGSWKPLEGTKYKRNIDKGIKMARQEMAPELITIPVINTQVTTQMESL